MANHIVESVTNHRVHPLLPQITRAMIAVKNGANASNSRACGVNSSNRLTGTICRVYLPEEGRNQAIVG